MILLADCEGGETDIVFILDASGSIGDRNFDIMRDFVASIIRELDVDNGRLRVGLMTFSNFPTEQFYLNTYSNRNAMLIAVDNIRYTRGTTNTAAALEFARQTMFTVFRGDRIGVPDMVVIITDGESNDGPETLIQAKLAKEEGIHIISVGVGNWIDRYELEIMASHPFEINMIHVDSFDALSTIVYVLRDALCDSKYWL